MVVLVVVVVETGFCGKGHTDGQGDKSVIYMVTPIIISLIVWVKYDKPNSVN